MLDVRSRLVVPLIIVGCASLSGRDALADWPQSRADATRTGAVGGTGEATAPVPYWRYYLGGDIDPAAAAFVDVDGDDEGEVVYIAGGKLVAKERTNAIAWESKTIDARWIIGIDDLDGDGVAEIVLAASDRVYAIDPATGLTLWEQSGDDLGTLGDARLSDLDGDGITDLLTQECGCCRVNNGNTGFAYRFADGFAAAEQLWTLPEAQCAGKRSMAIVDVDGDSGLEVLNGSNTALSVLDGASGAVLATSETLGERIAESRCAPVNVDSVPGEELVCVQSSSPLNLPGTGHRVYVLHYAAGDPATLTVVWEQDVGELDSTVGIPAGHIVDLDGDGALEIVLSGTLAGDITNTYVFDAALGTPLVTVTDRRAVGTMALELAGSSLLLATDGAELFAYTFDRASVPMVSTAWSLPDRRAITTVDADGLRRMHGATKLLTLDLDGDGASELMTASTALGGAVIGFDVSGAAPQVVSTFAIDADADILAGWGFDKSTGDPARVLLAPTNGIMELLDDGFDTLSPGVRFGGYYAKGDWRNLQLTPVTGDLGGFADSILIADSRGSLVRIDGVGATLSAPGTATWEIPDTDSPVIVAGLNGADTGVMCVQRAGDTDSVSAYDVDATRLWSSSIPGAILADVVPADLDGDSTPDAIAQWGRRSDRILEHRALRGTNGSVLWDAPAHSAGTTRLPAGGAVTDWNSDGVDDFVYQFYGTHVLSGSNGAMLSTTGFELLFYFMPTIADVDGDGEDEVTLHGGYNEARTLEKDLGTSLWVGAEVDRPYPYGSIVQCGSTSRLVEGSLVNSATLKSTILGGAQAGEFSSLVLGEGQAFATVADATAADVRLGQLTSTSAHTDLGDGRPAAVVGSSDGWLYAVDPCTTTLTYAVNLGAEVGAVAFADTDGDGLDELVVSVGDGYLYVLRNAPIDAPDWVLDTDPPRGLTDIDVDFIFHSDSMSALWAAVPGADSYEVGIVRVSDSQFVSDPVWRDVGDTTEATVNGLSLDDGEVYLFVVRAIKDSLPSPDVPSDGVNVVLEGGGDAGPGGDDGGIPVDDPDEVGGCCSGAPAGAGSLFLGFVVFGLLAVGRRKRLHR